MPGLEVDPMRIACLCLASLLSLPATADEAVPLTRSERQAAYSGGLCFLDAIRGADWVKGEGERRRARSVALLRRRLTAEGMKALQCRELPVAPVTVCIRAMDDRSDVAAACAAAPRIREQVALFWEVVRGG